MHIAHFPRSYRCDPRELSVSSADYNLGNADTPSNRGIPEDNCPSRFCIPACHPRNVRIVIMTRVYTSRFRAALSPGRIPVAHIAVILPGGFVSRGGKVFIEGRTPCLPVPLINGETHARKNRAPFPPGELVRGGEFLGTKDERARRAALTDPIRRTRIPLFMIDHYSSTAGVDRPR